MLTLSNLKKYITLNILISLPIYSPLLSIFSLKTLNILVLRITVVKSLLLTPMPGLLQRTFPLNASSVGHRSRPPALFAGH